MKIFSGAIAWSSRRMEFALALVIFTMSGKYLDKRFLTSPAFTLIGFALALAVGFASLFGTIRRLDSLEKDDSKDK